MTDKIGMLKIDHHEAVLYLLGGIEEGKVLEEIPADPRHRRWHIHHKKSLHLKGQNNPEDHRYFKELIHDIRGLTGIVLVGHGTGKSNEAHNFEKYMDEHHKDLKNIVIGHLVEDHHETEKELLAAADKMVGEKHLGHHNRN
ncbi:hypothetical protein K5X82_00095 [Halosquirtibacter xylanolyticus]|uniref:hypothetical protein n=1 Tax=Halosquirtibacter xylanolyticus TaxID=3374599 RepID=UPI003749C42A|nr:hypothetical protein K5X82_00095 [Prolixibacteraceae bacterium]